MLPPGKNQAQVVLQLWGWGLVRSQTLPTKPWPRSSHFSSSSSLHLNPFVWTPPPRARCSAPRREQETDSSGTELPGTPPPAPRWVPLRQGRKSSAILGGRVIVSDSSSQPCSDLSTGAGFYQSQEGQRLRQTGPVLPGTCRAVGLAHAAGLTTLTESQNHLTALRGATWAN